MHVLLVDEFYPANLVLRGQRMGYWMEGIPKTGDTYSLYSKTKGEEFADVALTWGPRTGGLAKRSGFHHLVMECGFLGDRGRNFALCISDLNGRGRPALKTIKGRGEPWYESCVPCRKGHHERVAIMCQVPRDSSLIPLSEQPELQEKHYLEWLNGVVALCKAKGMEVGLRRHPGVSLRWWDIHRPAGILDLTYDRWPKEKIWEWADVATAFSSNCLVEAYMAGVDVVPSHPTSLTWPVRSYFGQPRTISIKKKYDWVDWVASYQCSIDEIESGEAWVKVRENL